MLRYLSGFWALLVCDTAAQLALKAAALAAGPFSANLDWLLKVASDYWVYGAIAAYLGSFLAWIGLLRRLPMGTAVGASHSEVVVVMLVSVPIFNEHISFQQCVGAALIIGGIALLVYGEVRAQTNSESVADPI